MSCPNVISVLRIMKQLLKPQYKILFVIRNGQLWEEMKIKRLRVLNFPRTGVSLVCQGQPPLTKVWNLPITSCILHFACVSSLRYWSIRHANEVLTKVIL